MVDPSSGHVLAFNGELYNYQAIRAELSEVGETFTSSGDTAVMLRALAKYGREALPRFRGMFAFGLWDAKQRQLMLARDALGMKPLYVCVNDAPSSERTWSLMFASELRAILASRLLGTPRLNPDAVASMVWNGFVMGPATAVKNVESLMPGEVRVYDVSGQPQCAEQFWHMPAAQGEQLTDETELAAALEESVAMHLHSERAAGRVFIQWRGFGEHGQPRTTPRFAADQHVHAGI